MKKNNSNRGNWARKVSIFLLSKKKTKKGFDFFSDSRKQIKDKAFNFLRFDAIRVLGCPQSNLNRSSLIWYEWTAKNQRKQSDLVMQWWFGEKGLKFSKHVYTTFVICSSEKRFKVSKIFVLFLLTNYICIYIDYFNKKFWLFQYTNVQL